uniref:Reverse transcriptase n=1 Tax=Peronospora matthiolae TaxID=2874970 RepID=A0AAV1TBJ8_9STRA
MEESSGVPESKHSRESYVEGMDPQLPADVLSQEITETVNVLVNDGSSVGAYTLDLVAPPKSASKVVKLPTLESKRFVRDLRSDKIKQICILVTEDEFVAVIRSAQVFAENERVLSSSSMSESVLDEKTRIELYTSQSWESLKTNSLYKDLDEFKDVFPESVPCELPKDKGTRHEIELKPGSKYCVMKQWPLPREQVTSIDKFFADRLGWSCEGISIPTQLSYLLCAKSHRRVADSARIHQTECYNSTSLDADTEKGRHH